MKHPQYDFCDVYRIIMDNNYKIDKAKLESVSQLILDQEEQIFFLGENDRLEGFQLISQDGFDHLKGLYEKFRENEPFDKIRSDIKTIFNSICPYCGVYHTTLTFDHFFPQKRAKELSVVPINLIAVCKDCNSAKSSLFSSEREKLLFHPYFDDYFTSDWIVASFDEASKGIIFSCQPPDDISEIEKKRYNFFFNRFNLATIAASCAGNELGNNYRFISVISDEDNLRKIFIDEYKESKSQRKLWRAALYKLLSETENVIEKITAIVTNLKT